MPRVSSSPIRCAFPPHPSHEEILCIEIYPYIDISDRTLRMDTSESLHARYPSSCSAVRTRFVRLALYYILRVSDNGMYLSRCVGGGRVVRQRVMFSSSGSTSMSGTPLAAFIGFTWLMDWIRGGPRTTVGVRMPYVTVGHVHRDAVGVPLALSGVAYKWQFSPSVRHFFGCPACPGSRLVPTLRDFWAS